MSNSVDNNEIKNENNKQTNDYMIKIFWDYQNVTIPAKKMNYCNLIYRLTNLHQQFSDVGTVVSKEIYIDQENKSDTKWEKQLHDSGFKFIHCPTRHLCEGNGKVEVCEKCKKPLNSSDVKKESVDMNIINSMWEFAYNCRADEKKCCICIITSDGDFCYTLSALKTLGCNIIVLHGTHPHSNLEMYDKYISFHSEILNLSYETSDTSKVTDDMRIFIDSVYKDR